MGNERKKDYIFISYSWHVKEPDDSVLNLVAKLRIDGYNAICDVIRLQEETAMNFNQMMAESFSSANKVIIVLSQSYKEKADSFRGGVGEEYKFIISDITSQNKKYILVSYENNVDLVMPNFIKGRQVVFLPRQYDLLLHKLNDTSPYRFPNVGNVVVQPSSLQIFGLDSNTGSSHNSINSFRKNEQPQTELQDPLSVRHENITQGNKKRNVEILRISSKSEPKSVAGAVAAILRTGKSVELNAIGYLAVNQVIKSLAVARGYVAPNGIDLVFIPSFSQLEVDGSEKTSLKFLVERR